MEKNTKIREDLDNHIELTKKAFDKVKEDNIELRKNVQKLIVLLSENVLTQKQKDKVVQQRTLGEELERLYMLL